MPEVIRARGTSEGELPELDPFGEVPDERYGLDASELTRRFGEAGRGQVRVEDAHITGRLDLGALNAAVDLVFERCRFEQPPEAGLASLLGLRFHRCWLPGLDARGLRTRGDFRLTRSVVEISGTSPDRDWERAPRSSAVDLTDAVVGGSVVLAETTVSRRYGWAIGADRLRVTGELVAEKLVANGAVRFPGLSTGGDADFSGAELTYPDGVAFDGSGAHIGGSLRGEGLSVKGMLSLVRATVDGDAVFRGAQLEAILYGSAARLVVHPDQDQRPALLADGLTVGGDLELSDGLDARGTLRIVRARIGGTLRLARAQLEAVNHWSAPSLQPALHLDGSSIGGDIEASELQASSGQLRLADVSVGGNVQARNVGLDCSGLDAVSAPRLKVTGTLQLVGSVIQGTLRFPEVEIGGSLNLWATRLLTPGPDGLSLDAGGARIGKDLLLIFDRSRPFTADGGVSLVRAVVAGRVDLNRADLMSPPQRGVSLDASHSTAGVFRLTFGGPPGGRVVLRRARCGTFADNVDLWNATGGVDLDGFAYEDLKPLPEPADDAGVKARLAWQRMAMREYRPGPYDQLAGVLRSAGDHGHAAVVLVEKHRRQYEERVQGARALGRAWHPWSWLQRVVTGYGHRPARALAWLVGLGALLAGTETLTSAGSGTRKWTLVALLVVTVLVLAAGLAGAAHRWDDQRAFTRISTAALAPLPPASFDVSPPPVRVAPAATETTISVDAYLGTDDLRLARAALTALDDLVLELGYGELSEVDIQLGSVFRRAKAGVRKGLKSQEVRDRLVKAERALELKVLDVQQAEVDLKQADAVSRLIGSLQDLPEACMRVGSILLVKYTDGDKPVLLSRTLSQLEIRAMDRYPEIQCRPAEALTALTTAVLSIDPESDDGPRLIE